MKWIFLLAVYVVLTFCDWIPGQEHPAMLIGLFGVFVALASADSQTKTSPIMRASLCTIPMLVVASQAQSQAHPLAHGLWIAAAFLIVLVAMLWVWRCNPSGGWGDDPGPDFAPPSPPGEGLGLDWDDFDLKRSSWDTASKR